MNKGLRNEMLVSKSRFVNEELMIQDLDLGMAGRWKAPGRAALGVVEPPGTSNGGALSRGSSQNNT